MFFFFGHCGLGGEHKKNVAKKRKGRVGGGGGWGGGGGVSCSVMMQYAIF